MDGRLTIGDPKFLGFELRWELRDPEGTAAEATRGDLVVLSQERTLWGNSFAGDQGFSWTWIELLEHLARYWAYLLIEEGDPLGLNVPPEQLRSRAEQRWGALSSAQQSLEDEALWAYLEIHDLSNALKGAYPPALWLTREGESLRVASRDVVTRVPIAEARATLSSLGDVLAERVALLADERAGAARAAWSQRESVEGRRLAQIATGADDEQLGSLFEVISPKALRFDAAFDPDEYLAVARMTGRQLGADDLRELFACIKVLPSVWTTPIDKHTEQIEEILRAMELDQPFEQGQAVARWFRTIALCLTDDVAVDPASVLEQWSIPVNDMALASRDVDAISVWGAHHGPAVLVNRKGRHGRGNGRRATVAHELAHLLMDRRDALPVAEVVGGRVSTRVEMRARAFAAEVLMPMTVAKARVMAAASARDLEDAVRALSQHYGASMEIIAWQALNGLGSELPRGVTRYLKSLTNSV